MELPDWGMNKNNWRLVLEQQISLFFNQKAKAQGEIRLFIHFKDIEDANLTSEKK